MAIAVNTAAMEPTRLLVSIIVYHAKKNTAASTAKVKHLNYNTFILLHKLLS